MTCLTWTAGNTTFLIVVSYYPCILESILDPCTHTTHSDKVVDGERDGHCGCSKLGRNLPGKS